MSKRTNVFTFVTLGDTPILAQSVTNTSCTTHPTCLSWNLCVLPLS